MFLKWIARWAKTCLQDSVSLGDSQVRSCETEGELERRCWEIKENIPDPEFKPHSKNWNLLILDGSKEHCTLNIGAGETVVMSTGCSFQRPRFNSHNYMEAHKSP